jgi:hypothetical protein
MRTLYTARASLTHADARFKSLCGHILRLRCDVCRTTAVRTSKADAVISDMTKQTH